MSTSHVEELLVPLMRDELDASERGRVETHLAGCAACREARADFERVSAALARPAAPAVHWGAYRAELREKLSARGAPRSPQWRWGWFGRLQALPIAMAVGLVAVMIYIGVPGFGSLGDSDPGIEGTVLGSRLDLVERLDLVQRLDLLEDLDVIRRLDGLEASREG